MLRQRTTGLPRLLVAAAILCSTLLAATVAAAAPTQVDAKRAEAEAILAQLQEMDAQLEQAVEAYNGAAVRLDQLQAEEETARRHLRIAQRSSKEAQTRLSDRIVSLYLNGGDPSVLEIILGAADLDEALDRLDAAKRVSEQDASILEALIVTRTDVRRLTTRLHRAVRDQRDTVNQRAAARAEIERRIGERRAYYASVREQIAELVEAERERQRQLATEARRRQQEQLQEQRELAAAAEAVGVSTAAIAPTSTAIPQGIGSSPASPTGQRAVQIAMQYLGIRYVWGAADPGVGFDCSGLTMYVYAQLGISLPHYAASQYGMGVPVSREQLAAGDLVFFRGLGHMGMYIGGGQFIHAPRTGDVVKISSLSDSYYVANWVGARRVT